MPFNLNLSLPSADAVMRVLEARFDWTFLGLLVIVWLWSTFMVARGLAERQLEREAKIARLGGWVYLGIGALGYLTVQAYYFILF